MDVNSSPDRPRYTVSVRIPAPENLKERISAALAQAVKQRQARPQANQQSAAQVLEHRDGGAPKRPAERNHDAPSL